MMLPAWLVALGQGLICLALSPLTIGALRKTSARLQRREGPSLWQPYHDLAKLLRKRPVLPNGTPWLFAVVPALTFACYGGLACLAPTVLLTFHVLPGTSDLLALIYLLGLARLALGMGGLAVGAPLGGLGSSREMFLHVLAEPALILVFGVLALRWGTTSLEIILQKHYEAAYRLYADPALLLLFLALCLVILVEAGRLPFDNPASHLELTMFGKAIFLEYSGWHLALLEWGEWALLTFLLSLLANLVASWLMPTSTSSWWLMAILVALYPVKLVILAGMLALWEVRQVKLRLRETITPALMASALALVAAMVLVAGRYVSS